MAGGSLSWDGATTSTQTYDCPTHRAQHFVDRFGASVERLLPLALVRFYLLPPFHEAPLRHDLNGLVPFKRLLERAAEVLTVACAGRP